jgi:hypothetical protein
LALKSALLEPPTTRARVLVAVAIGLAGALVVHQQYARAATVHTDFGMVWFGAQAFSQGADPYSLIGPGRAFDYVWPLIYPATALVAVMPLSLLTEHVAAVVFVGISSFLLAFGVTKNGWHLLPLFTTEAYANAARLGQWSILFTAFLFLPWIGLILGAKPQGALPLLAATTSRRGIWLTVLGGAILFAVSLVLQPTWPVRWIEGVRQARFMESPISQFGGPLVLLALVRWRRPEAWLIVVLACMPQAPAWYSTLPLFAIPAGFGEAVAMAFVATLFGWIGATLMPQTSSAAELYRWVGAIIVVSVYLPATALVLRRPNRGPSPAWLQIFLDLWHHRSARA